MTAVAALYAAIAELLCQQGLGKSSQLGELLHLQRLAVALQTIQQHDEAAEAGPAPQLLYHEGARCLDTLVTLQIFPQHFYHRQRGSIGQALLQILAIAGLVGLLVASLAK